MSFTPWARWKRRKNYCKPATNILSQQPQALQLRYMQTLTDIAGERTNTIVFPLPLDLIDALMNKPK